MGGVVLKGGLYKGGKTYTGRIDENDGFSSQDLADLVTNGLAVDENQVQLDRQAAKASEETLKSQIEQLKVQLESRDAIIVERDKEMETLKSQIEQLKAKDAKSKAN